MSKKTTIIFTDEAYEKLSKHKIVMQKKNIKIRVKDSDVVNEIFEGLK